MSLQYCCNPANLFNPELSNIFRVKYTVMGIVHGALSSLAPTLFNQGIMQFIRMMPAVVFQAAAFGMGFVI
jgi:hypothetical protein